MDIDYGAWQMRTHDEVKARGTRGLPAVARRRRSSCAFPTGESLQDVVARTRDVLRLVLVRHPSETVVMVGHDSVNRALLLQLLDQPLSAYWRLVQDPCTLNEIDVEGDESRCGASTTPAIWTETEQPRLIMDRWP